MNIQTSSTNSILNPYRSYPTKIAAQFETETAFAISAAEETVTISNDAKRLAEITPMPLPEVPANHTLNEVTTSAEKYAEFQLLKMQYQVASDMTNLAMGTNNGMSASTAYYLSRHDEAREATVNHMADKQQANLFQTYINTSESINAWA